ncbi:MAG: gamma-glutamyltransferase, partial [Nitrospinota bacterium]
MRFKKARIGSVAGPHPATVKAGMSVLRQGGNAVDAAVAAGFTEGVVDPHWNGIAGYGGCMVIYIAEKKKVVSVDYNSRAPQAASSRMFKIEKANSPAGYRVPDRENIIGPKAVGVPGIVAGLCLALERFGSMPLVEVIKPAIRSARYGFEYQLGLRNSASGMADVWSERFPETFRVFLKNGLPPQPGERFKNPDLARTLDAIAEGGTEVFYRGEIGEKIADHIQAERGCLSRKDMADYRARVVQPSKTMYRGYTVHTPPPPAA